MTTTKTILVLGATGKTGRRLLPYLSARGATVRAASRQAGEGRTRFGADAVGGIGLAVPGFVDEDRKSVV